MFLELGQRPDEPGPPIHGAKTYPAEVTARLTADAETIIAKYPQGRSALLPLLHLVQSEDGMPHTRGYRVLRQAVGPDRGRGHRGGDVLLDVPPHAHR